MSDENNGDESDDGNVGVGSEVEFEVIPPGEQNEDDTTDSSNNQ
jgi:hypothetical protein